MLMKLKGRQRAESTEAVAWGDWSVVEDGVGAKGQS